MYIIDESVKLDLSKISELEGDVVEGWNGRHPSTAVAYRDSAVGVNGCGERQQSSQAKAVRCGQDWQACSSK